MKTSLKLSFGKTKTPELITISVPSQLKADLERLKETKKGSYEKAPGRKHYIFVGNIDDFHKFVAFGRQENFVVYTFYFF